MLFLNRIFLIMNIVQKELKRKTKEMLKKQKSKTAFTTEITEATEKRLKERTKKELPKRVKEGNKVFIF